MLVLLHGMPRTCFDMALKAQDHRAETVECADDIERWLEHVSADAIVLDITSDPKVVGWAKRYRERGGNVPICFAGKAWSVDRAALYSIADDLITLPVSGAEFVARVAAVARRARGFSSSRFTFGRLVIDQDRKIVLVDGRPVHLTGKEFMMLDFLVMRHGRVVTKESILGALYAGIDEPEMKIVDVFLCKLRKKVPYDLIQTIWGRGYVVPSEWRTAGEAGLAKAA